MQKCSVNSWQISAGHPQLLNSLFRVPRFQPPLTCTLTEINSNVVVMWILEGSCKNFRLIHINRRQFVREIVNWEKVKWTVISLTSSHVGTPIEMHITELKFIWWVLIDDVVTGLQHIVRTTIRNEIPSYMYGMFQIGWNPKHVSGVFRIYKFRRQWIWIFKRFC
jgi:hypothetical protein